MHKPIQFQNLSLSFPHKTCFADFSGQITYGSRIAMIGRNGSGKSTLLKWFAGLIDPFGGEIKYPTEWRVGYVPQLIDAFDSFSGAQRFNKALTEALSLSPDILMLDEPTNHLDCNNRRSLVRMLRAFEGTLIMVTHDIELLNATVETIWHIDNGRVAVFSGCYDDYQRELMIQRVAITDELADLNRKKEQAHHALMQEQARAKSSRIQGEKHIQQRKWPTIVSDAKARNAQETSGRKKRSINHKKQELIERLSECQVPEIIQPKFSLNGIESNQTLVTISGGVVGYEGNLPILQNLSLSSKSRERIAIQGHNGSGKSTLVKAILGDNSIIRQGEWILPRSQEIGYLDQHYGTLSQDMTVFDTLSVLLRDRSYLDIRKHLNDFLFRKNEEVAAKVSTLSGGEKARLSLAQIAAITPKLLILDEMTNNLDLETREHVIQVLQNYPGSMLVISHDSVFLKAIGVTDWYDLKDGLLSPIK
ncbi:MAG: ABC-F family ATP-binding cassette domain-containing protein [Tatlockia sp.]|nr:ABC-F family ATP-binding cassette domain-containing protein [Tatlockia sp.]